MKITKKAIGLTTIGLVTMIYGTCAMIVTTTGVYNTFPGFNIDLGFVLTNNPLALIITVVGGILCFRSILYYFKDDD